MINLQGQPQGKNRIQYLPVITRRRDKQQRQKEENKESKIKQKQSHVGPKQQSTDGTVWDTFMDTKLKGYAKVIP